MWKCKLLLLYKDKEFVPPKERNKGIKKLNIHLIPVRGVLVWTLQRKRGGLELRVLKVRSVDLLPMQEEENQRVSLTDMLKCILSQWTKIPQILCEMDRNQSHLLRTSLKTRLSAPMWHERRPLVSQVMCKRNKGRKRNLLSSIQDVTRTFLMAFKKDNMLKRHAGQVTEFQPDTTYRYNKAREL